MQINVIETASVPSLGMAIGSVANSELLQKLNAKIHSSGFFQNVNDYIRQGREMFVNNFINPIRETYRKVKNTVKSLTMSDTIRPIITEKDFNNIPPCMYEPILTYQPVRDLFNDGRIFGFGLEPEQIRPDDPYDRMIHNGFTENLLDENVDLKEVECVSVWYADDPDITTEEIDYIEMTRMFIDQILNDTPYDPTDWKNRRG